jgi:hypothetical protein
MKLARSFSLPLQHIMTEEMLLAGNETTMTVMFYDDDAFI